MVALGHANCGETLKQRIAGTIQTIRPGTLQECFSTAGPRPGTGPWHQLHRAARDSPGICHFSF